MNRRRTRVTVEIALTIALAVVLSMITVWKMPYGGSVSLGMLPLLILALRRGLAPGLAAGALYGVIDLLVDPFPPVHWIQPLLDYPIAYLMVGLAGVAHVGVVRALHRDARLRASAWIVAGVALAGLGRYTAHFTSGIVFFGEYAPEGQPVWLYSAIYNLYVPLSALTAWTASSSSAVDGFIVCPPLTTTSTPRLSRISTTPSPAPTATKPRGFGGAPDAPDSARRPSDRASVCWRMLLM